MKKPTKVTCEITAFGYTWKVFSGDEVLSERSMKKTGTGAIAASAGDFYDDFQDDFEEFGSALEDGDAYDIMDQLSNINDEF